MSRPNDEGLTASDVIADSVRLRESYSGYQAAVEDAHRKAKIYFDLESRNALLGGPSSSQAPAELQEIVTNAEIRLRDERRKRFRALYDRTYASELRRRRDEFEVAYTALVALADGYRDLHHALDRLAREHHSEIPVSILGQDEFTRHTRDTWVARAHRLLPDAGGFVERFLPRPIHELIKEALSA